MMFYYNFSKVIVTLEYKVNVLIALTHMDLSMINHVAHENRRQ